MDSVALVPKLFSDVFWSEMMIFVFFGTQSVLLPKRGTRIYPSPENFSANTDNFFHINWMSASLSCEESNKSIRVVE